MARYDRSEDFFRLAAQGWPTKRRRNPMEYVNFAFLAGGIGYDVFYLSQHVHTLSPQQLLIAYGMAQLPQFGVGLAGFVLDRGTTALCISIARLRGVPKEDIYKLEDYKQKEDDESPFREVFRLRYNGHQLESIVRDVKIEGEYLLKSALRPGYGIVNGAPRLWAAVTNLHAASQYARGIFPDLSDE